MKCPKCLGQRQHFLEDANAENGRPILVTCSHCDGAGEVSCSHGSERQLEDEK